MEKGPSIIVGIDAGYANLGFVVLSEHNFSRPLFSGRFRLMAGKYSEQALLHACYDFFERNDIKMWLERADTIVLEYQKDRKFATVNMFPIARYFQKCLVVHPNTVGKIFGLALDRKQKKQDAVTLWKKNCVLGQVKGKKDDIADAFLLAVYYLKQNLDLVGWRELEDGERNGSNNSISDGDTRRSRKRQLDEE